VQSFIEKRPPSFTMKVSTDMPGYFERWRAAGSVGEFVKGEKA